MIFLCNTFSPKMLGLESVGEGHGVSVERISAAEAGRILRECEVMSCFGHAGAAWHLGRYLRTRIPVNRDEIRLGPEDVLIVASVANKRRFLTGTEGAPRWVFYRIQVLGTVP